MLNLSFQSCLERDMLGKSLLDGHLRTAVIPGHWTRKVFSIVGPG
jgi:hypothetical protein